MEQWQSLIDEQIRKVIGDGNSARLPGAGKPLALLALDDDKTTPPDLRLAYKILRDNDITPDWIALGRDLEVERERIIAHLAVAYRQYRGRVADARRANSALAEVQAEALWSSAQRKTEAAITAYNKAALTYNLKVPVGVAQRAALTWAQALRLATGA